MEYILCGCVGGLIPDLLRIIKNRYEVKLPVYLSSLNFYIGLVLLIAIGGFSVFLKGSADYIEALAIGYSAPQILSSLLGGVSQKGKEDTKEEVRSVNPVKFILSWWKM
jgi:hypothetical protein